MDLESVADELYQASPEEFVERRKDRAAEARTAKDRPLVKAITGLRRPTRSAWLVNLLAHESPDQVAGLLELGASLGEAQRRGSGTDLRRLSKERQATLDRLTRAAVALAAAQGHSATEATRQEVSQTLQAALADSAVAELVRVGRVVQPASYGGFGPMDVFGGGLTLVPAPAESGSGDGSDPGAAEPGPASGSEAPQSAAQQLAGRPADPERTEQEEAARHAVEAAIAAAQQTVAAAQEALEDAREEAAQADSDAEQATADADRLADEVENLRAQLREAEEEERRAGQNARSARKRSQELHRTAQAAEHQLAVAQRELDDLKPA